MMESISLSRLDWITHLITVYATTSGAIFAVVITLWSDKRLVYQKSYFILSLIFSLLSLALVLSTSLTAFTSLSSNYATPVILLSLLLFCLALFSLAFGMLHAHLVDRLIRVRRFFQGLMPSKIKLSAKRIKHIRQQQERVLPNLLGINYTREQLDFMSAGYVVLVKLNNHNEQLIKDQIDFFLLSRLSSGDTLDYVTTDKHPYLIQERLSRAAKKKKITLTEISKDDIVIIDAYSPLYGLFEDIHIEKEATADMEYRLLRANSLASIHSAAISAWYIHKQRLLKDKGKSLRKPHTMVYDHISSLSLFEDEVDIVRFLRHVVSAERAYGMLTIFLEYIDTPTEVLHALEQIVDEVFVTTYENGLPQLTNVFSMNTSTSEKVVIGVTNE